MRLDACDNCLIRKGCDIFSEMCELSPREVVRLRPDLIGTDRFEATAIRGPGRPPKSEPRPTLPQYTDGRYRRKRKRSEQIPIELDEPQEFSPEYRAWVGQILQGN
jgi:hypothetical protein